MSEFLVVRLGLSVAEIRDQQDKENTEEVEPCWLFGGGAKVRVEGENF